MTDDIRADVAAALAGTLGGDEGGDETPTEAPPAESLGGADESPAPVAEAVGGDAPLTDAPPEEAPAKPGDAGRARDATGRFVQGKGDAKAPVRPAPAGAPVAAPKPNGAAPPAPGAPAQAPADAPKPPPQWKPAAREQWAKLPPAVQAEVIRVENDTKRALQESSTSRRVHQEFSQAATPYEAMFRADGVSAIQAASNLFQTAYALRTGPPAQKAALLANIIHTFGVPIDALSAALGGQAAPQGPQQGGEYRDPRVDQLYARAEAAERQRAAMTQQQVRSELQALSQKAEFLPDVKEHMAVLMETGQAQTLEEAYDAACWSNKEIRGILQKREAVTAAKASQASTQRARAASMSVRTQPATAAPPAAKTGTVEDDVRAAMAELRSR